MTSRAPALRTGPGRLGLVGLVLSLVAVSITTTTTQNRTGDDDFYYYGETRIHLQRSTDEVIVALEPSAGSGTEDTVRSLLPDAGVTTGPITSDRSYRLLTLRPEQNGGRPASAVIDSLAGVQGVEFAAPVFRHRGTGTRLLPTGELIVRARSGQGLAEIRTLATARGFEIARALRGTADQFVLRVPAGRDMLVAARELHESGQVTWAEPNFVAEYRRSAVPNDPRFGDQWHLRNTEQKGGLTGADIQAVEAWDIEAGNPDVVIAVIDDGVEVTHEDLAANIFVNAGEVAGNGVDDDENGYVDDVRGWDFFANDNNAQPETSNDNHGTAVAGIAAARGGNGIGVTGVCQRCRILPIRIFNGGNAPSSDRIAEAIRYAASSADVINNSWGGGAPSNAINAALDFATTSGRGGRGTVVVAAAGNESGGIARLFINGLPPGTHRFRWTFSKDDTVSAGDDAAWVATVDFPGFPTLSFDTGILPPGWTTGGDAGWTQVVDPLHADEGVCSVTSLRSNPIGHSQSTYVEALRALPGGNFATMVFVSSEAGFDGLKVQIDLHNDGTINFESGTLSGVPPNEVSYPAAYPASIGVGASSNYDCRSPYSQTGAALTLVAPGSAGPRNPGIHTTDRSGTAGYASGAYIDDFGGTSSSTPLVSGVVGLMLSRNPELNPAMVRAILESSADKVGPEPYINGRNDRYGAGRLNARRALEAAGLPGGPLPAPVITRHPASQVVPSGGTVRLSVGATGSPLSYQWYQGASGDTSAPVAGATGQAFDTPAVTIPVRYWVRVTNTTGSADSSSAELGVGATWDPGFRIPRCNWVTNVCDSGRLLNGRGPMGPEVNAPNTFSSCSDGTSRNVIHQIDRIHVETVDGANFAAGGTVRIIVETVTSLAPARLRLYVRPSTGSPWTPVAVLVAPFAGPHAFTTTLRLPPGASPILRAELREAAEEGSGCNVQNGTSDYDDIALLSNDVPTLPFIADFETRVISEHTIVTTVPLRFVTVSNTSPITYQWYRGTSGDTSSPIAGATLSGFSAPVSLEEPTYYWVRVTNPVGSTDSETAVVSHTAPKTAVYDTVLRAPRCELTDTCFSLTPGRPSTVSSEVNHPNTIYAACQDGSGGGSATESITSIRVRTLEGGPLAPRRRVEVTVQYVAVSTLFNFVEVYHTADATSPGWRHVATARATPLGAMTAQFILPEGPLQAIRARIRYQGTQGPCGPGGPASYDDHDDVIFATTPTGAPNPVIASQPQSQLVPEGATATLTVEAIGTGLSYQWFRGTSGDAANPVPGATTAAIDVQAVSTPAPYWVRVTSATGAVESTTATVRGVSVAAAVYDGTLKTPLCAALVAWCDSAALLAGRGPLGPEANAPNTLFTACADGQSGRWQTDESIESITVSTVDGDLFAPGRLTKVEVTAFIVSHASNFVDLYYADHAFAPEWRHMATLTAPAGGLQRLSTAYVLPDGAVQAIRARLRYRTVQAPCGTSAYDDHDDLVFAVGTSYTPSFTTTTAATTTVNTRPASPMAAGPVTTASFLFGSEAAAMTSARLLPDGNALSDAAERRRFDEEAALAEVSLSDEAALELVARATAVSPEPTVAASERAPQNEVTYGQPQRFELTFDAGPPPIVEGAATTASRPLSEFRIRFDEPPAGPAAHGSCVIHIDRASTMTFLVGDRADATTSGTAGSAKTLANAQCAVDLRTVRVAGTDAVPQVRVTVRFSDRHASPVHVHTQTVDDFGAATAWTKQEPQGSELRGTPKTWTQ